MGLSPDPAKSMDSDSNAWRSVHVDAVFWLRKATDIPVAVGSSGAFSGSGSSGPVWALVSSSMAAASGSGAAGTISDSSLAMKRNSCVHSYELRQVATQHQNTALPPKVTEDGGDETGKPEETRVKIRMVRVDI